MTVHLAPRASAPKAARFRHEALFYAGLEDFLSAVLPFVRGGIAAGEPTLVAVDDARQDRLRQSLGRDASEVRFLDMPKVGRNPGRIIPEWRAFVDEHGGRPVRGVGEPVWPERTEEELEECRLHEGLLNTAFEDGAPWWLVCPYDTTTLGPGVLEAAWTTHPTVRNLGRSAPSPTYAGANPQGWDRSGLRPLGRPVVHLRFGPDALQRVRRRTMDAAAEAGFTSERAESMVLAVNELATNSLKYAGGGGTMRLWRDETGLVCEVTDPGVIGDPLVGRVHPPPTQVGGRGIWLVHQLCDLVQVRSFPGGTVVRARMDARA